MKKGEPSRTAFMVAHRRAQHQTVDGASIFRDPLAERILGEYTLPDLHHGDDPRPVRLFIAWRHRTAEDVVAAEYAHGVKQVVVLGAGLDTFAYRNEHADLRVFEVDHPSTQAWKRQRLADAGIDEAGVVFAGVDFETDDLRERLVAAGFDPATPSVIMWLGVVFYLTPDAVAGTLRTLASFERTTVVFDYPMPSDSPDRQAFLDRVAAIGEPFLSSFTPESIDELLVSTGFVFRDDRSIGDSGRGHVMIASNFTPVVE